MVHTSWASPSTGLLVPFPDILSLTKTPIPNNKQLSYGLALHPKSVSCSYSRHSLGWEWEWEWWWLGTGSGIPVAIPLPIPTMSVPLILVVAGVDGVEVAVEV